jgi:DNA-binding IclR family transcriptional regulator
MRHEAKHPVKTTEKTLEILELLKELDEAGVSELADRLDMGKSAVHNHLSTLREHHYVTKSEEKYRLGLKFLDLGGYTRSQMRLFRTAEPELSDLAQETGELVNIMCEEYGMGVYLVRWKGDQAVDIDTYTGRRTHLHTTALGKAILAHLPQSRVEAIVELHGLPAVTQHTTTDPDTLQDELDRVRERGYAVDDEERINGLRCVAAPVLDKDDTVLGAISVAAPTSRMTGERFRTEIPNAVQSTTNVVELNYKYP